MPQVVLVVLVLLVPRVSRELMVTQDRPAPQGSLVTRVKPGHREILVIRAFLEPTDLQA